MDLKHLIDISNKIVVFSGAGFSMDADFDDLPDKEKEIVVSNMRTSFYIPAERSFFL